jgi:hypothetical protein
LQVALDLAAEQTDPVQGVQGAVERLQEGEQQPVVAGESVALQPAPFGHGGGASVRTDPVMLATLSRGGLRPNHVRRGLGAVNLRSSVRLARGRSSRPRG